MSEFDDIISYLNKIVKIIKYNSMLVKKINNLNDMLYNTYSYKKRVEIIGEINKLKSEIIHINVKDEKIKIKEMLKETHLFTDNEINVFTDNFSFGDILYILEDKIKTK